MNDQTQPYNLNITYRVIAVLALVSAIVMGLVAYNKDSAQKAGAAESRVRSGSDIANMATAPSATTTIGAPSAFLIVGRATSTLTFPSENFNGLSAEITWMGTSSITSVLATNLSTSEDGVNFYPYDNSDLMIQGTGGTRSFASSSPALLWSPPTTNGTSTKSMKLPFIPAKYTRVAFSLSATSSQVNPDSIGFHAYMVGQVGGTQ